MADVNNAGNVNAWSPKPTGAVRVANVGAALPTDVETELNAGFASLGFVGEDGASESQSRDTEKKKAWGNAIVKVLTTDHESTFTFSLIETTNLEALKLTHGDGNVTVSDNGQISVAITADELPEKSFVIDMYDKGNGNEQRVVIPRGRVTEIGDTTWTHGDISQFEVTVEALDHDPRGKVLKYTKVSAETAAGGDDADNGEGEDESGN